MSRNINKYGSSVFAVSKSYRKLYENQHNFQILYFILMAHNRDASIYYSVPILILYPALSISAYLAQIDKYFNIDKQYQH